MGQRLSTQRERFCAWWRRRRVRPTEKSGPPSSPPLDEVLTGHELAALSSPSLAAPPAVMIVGHGKLPPEVSTAAPAGMVLPGQKGGVPYSEAVSAASSITMPSESVLDPGQTTASSSASIGSASKDEGRSQHSDVVVPGGTGTAPPSTSAEAKTTVATVAFSANSLSARPLDVPLKGARALLQKIRNDELGKTEVKKSGKKKKIFNLSTEDIVRVVCREIDRFQQQEAGSGSSGTNAVTSVVKLIQENIPGLAQTVGELGEYAPMIGMAFTFVRLAGNHFVATKETERGYAEFCTEVIITTHLLVQAEEWHAKKKLTLDEPIAEGLNRIWGVLDKFAEKIQEFGAQKYWQRLWNQKADLSELKTFTEALRQARSDSKFITQLIQTGMLRQLNRDQRKVLQQQKRILDRLASSPRDDDRLISTMKQASSETIESVNAACKAYLDEAIRVCQARNEEQPDLGRLWMIAANLQPSGFVGRAEEIERLSTLLQPSQWAAPVFRIVISGLPGTGKSSLAMHIATLPEITRRFTTGWKFDGSSQETLFVGLCELAGHLRLIQTTDHSPDAAVAAVKVFFGREDHSRWLFVIDNVNRADVASRLADLLPGSGGCILVTSQITDWSVGTWEEVGLKPMPLKESLRVLADDDDRSPEKETVAKRLGGLPLALAAAKAYKLENRVSWRDYEEHLSLGITQYVPSALELSLRAVVAEKVGVCDMIQILQILYHGGIPRPVVTGAYVAVRMADVTVSNPSEINALVVIHKTAAEEALKLLAKYSIINLDSTTVTVHQLMQEAMTSSAFAACTVDVAIKLGDTMCALVERYLLSDVILMRQMVHSLETVCAWMRKYGEESQRIGKLRMARTLRSIADIRIYCSDDTDNVIRLYEEASQLTSLEVNGKVAQSELEIAVSSHRFAIACGHAARGELQKTDGDKDSNTKKANILFQKKQQLLLESLEHFRQTAAKDRAAWCVVVLVDLANVSGELGLPEDQKARLDEALALLNETNGTGTYQESLILYSLGSYYHDKKKYMEQINLQRKSLKIELALNSKSLAVATTHASLAEAYCELNAYKEAQRHWRSCFNLRSRLLGSDDPQTNEAKEELAAVDHLLQESLLLSIPHDRDGTGDGGGERNGDAKGSAKGEEANDDALFDEDG